jgi:hypothetical protein
MAPRPCRRFCDRPARWYQTGIATPSVPPAYPARTASRGKNAITHRLLVLGAKPEPTLPPPGSFDAVACANASGRSAADLGLPSPVFTVLTALLTDGSAAGRMRLASLAGLATGTVHFYPQRLKGRTGVERSLFRLRTWRTTSFMLRRALSAVGFHYEHFAERSTGAYRRLILDLCRDDPEVAAELERKQASSGTLAVAIALAEPGVAQVIVSGFSFQLTQAVGIDPNIARRGTTASKHTVTDALVLRVLARHHPALVTTEAIVHEAAAVPLLATANPPRC